jgi:hypothetical protein
MSVAPRQHIVAAGESLATIATKYGIVSWEAIYTAPCNAELRKRRPNAKAIQPGDRVMIPPDERAVLRDRLAQLRRLKVDTTRVFDQLERALLLEIDRYRATGVGLDMTTGVALSFKGLVDIAKGGLQMSRAAATLDDVAKGSRGIAKGHVVGQGTNQVGMFGQAGAFDIGGYDSDLVAGLKHVTKSFFDMTSPSYWAGRWRKLLDGQHPEEAFDDAVQTLQAQRQQSMIAINHKIRLTEQMLQKATQRR